jgi:alpha-tubulin suppressor-like RCC1 family protein
MPLGVVGNRGDDPNEMGDNLPFVNLGSGMDAAVIAVGHYHVCALLMNGSVKCWGLNVNGRLGLGDSVNRGDSPGEMGDNLPVVSLSANNIKAKALTAGAAHTCVILEDNNVKCWGYNGSGQLGLGNTSDQGDKLNEIGASLPSVKLFNDQW